MNEQNAASRNILFGINRLEIIALESFFNSISRDLPSLLSLQLCGN